jgi:hypothetical protein
LPQLLAQARSDMSDNEFNPGTLLYRILNSGLPLHDMTIEIGKILRTGLARSFRRGRALTLKLR